MKLNLLFENRNFNYLEEILYGIKNNDLQYIKSNLSYAKQHMSRNEFQGLLNNLLLKELPDNIKKTILGHSDRVTFSGKRPGSSQSTMPPNISSKYQKAVADGIEKSGEGFIKLKGGRRKENTIQHEKNTNMYESIDFSVEGMPDDSLNVSNGAAKLILNYLGINNKGAVNIDPLEDFDGLSGEIDPRELLKRIDMLPHSDILSVPGYVDRGGNKATVISQGFDRERLDGYFSALRRIAISAIKFNKLIIWY